MGCQLFTNRNVWRKRQIKSFTAIGQIKEGDPYQADMSNGFCPFRRDVLWFESYEAFITQLLNQLDFTKNRKNWGYQFRFGLIAISEHDMQLITEAMHAIINTK